MISERGRPILRRFVTPVVLVLLISATFGGQPAQAATTRWVDKDGMAGPNNCAQTTPAYMTINAAVAAASAGDTIRVCPGGYLEDVAIPIALTLQGAQAGTPVFGRMFPSLSESTLTGVFTIQAANVTIDGFSVTRPGFDTGIDIKTAGNNALIINDIIDTIGGAAFSGNTQAVYLELGPDNVKVIGNRMRHIEGIASSNGGVFIGDSSSTNPSLNALIVGNTISDVHSVNRGAYAIHVNNGSRAQTAYTTVTIFGNTISDLLGGRWAHAIGLEGDTPGAVVRFNSISNVNAGTADQIAVLFQDDPSFATAHVNQNNFNVTPMVVYGIAVDPMNTPAGVVDGTCNWWNSPDGPGPVGTGSGALVSPKVTFAPWLTSPAPSRCGPPPPPKCKPGERDDGEGDVDETDNNGPHHGHFKFDECNGDQEVSHQDSDRNVDFHSDSANSSSPSFDAALPVATTTGQGWNNGEPVTYTLVVTDLGLGVGTDLYSLTLSDASGVIYTIAGTLTGGNINVTH